MIKKNISRTRRLPRRTPVAAQSTVKLAEHRAWLAKAAALAHLPVSKGGSPHPTVQVGTIIVSAKGHRLAAATNRMAQGVDWRKTERMANDGRSLWVNCAEQLAIASAARRGIALNGASLYLTLEPCTICAGLIVEAGIREVIIPAGALRQHARLKAKWRRSIEAGLVKLKEAGVRITVIDMNGKN